MTAKSTTQKTITARSTERGIMFSSRMVRAILDGKKVCTRRAVNEKTLRVSLARPVTNEGHAFGMEIITAPKGIHQARMNRGGAVTISELDFGVKPGEFNFRCPYVDGVTRLADYQRATPAGDRNIDRAGWRSCWQIRPYVNQRLWVRETWRKDGKAVRYRADDTTSPALLHTKWSPAIHMPRKHARIVLDVEEVHIERLHWIDDKEARDEGVSDRAEFETLWKDINGVASWDLNPFVWVINFGRIRT